MMHTLTDHKVSLVIVSLTVFKYSWRLILGERVKESLLHNCNRFILMPLYKRKTLT